MKKVSVIVPMYNIESYIEKCIDSLIKQTYKNIEILLVDDGSVVADWLRKNEIVNVAATVTGMAGFLRVIVPKLNMEIPFEENDEYDIEVCFKTIFDLIEAMNVFAVAESVSDLLKVKE